MRSRTGSPPSQRTWLADLFGEDRLLSAAETGEMLRKSPATLERWRREGTGPKFGYIGRSPLYRVGDVRDWIKANGKGRSFASDPPCGRPHTIGG